MRKLRILLLAFLLAGSAAYYCLAAIAAPTPTTVSSLMNVLKDNKQKAVYNINLNAPFSKETSGIKESVSAETGEVAVTNNIFDIPGRNGMDLSINLEYRSRDAKLKNESTTSTGGASYGQVVIAWYDVFDANGYWVKTGGLQYPANEPIQNEPTIDGQRWVFTGQCQYQTGTELFTSGDIKNALIEKSQPTAAKYIFGEGWSLDTPSLEVDGDNVYVNLPDGQTYKADFTTGTGLANYELTDIVFTKDATFGNGQDPSAYKLYYAGGDSYYFSANGELLVETDRFRNAIRYYYGDVNGKRLLTKIVDSVGRTVDIQYNDTATIFKCGEKTVQLIKTPIPGQTNKYYLSSFIDAQGRQFYYKYTFADAAFDQIGGTPANNQYANLLEIQYPTGAKTAYVWEKGKKNLGTKGYMEYFKVKERKDVDGERTYNQLTYQWFNEPDGYPTYKAETIDELYKYYSTVTDSRGVTTKYSFNSKHQPFKTEQYSDRPLAEAYTQYHTKYHLPIKTTSKTFNPKGDAFEQVVSYEYDHRGNVIEENNPDDPEEIDSDEHKTFYTYDFEYNLMTSRKFKQDKDTTVEIQYELSSDKKTVTKESVLGNGKLLAEKQYTYDEYGNVTSEQVENKPGELVTLDYEYGDEYKGAYLTAAVAKDVKDADGFTKDIRTEYTYDLNTGNRLTATDGNGNATTYQYDLLDRILEETYPDKKYTSYAYDDTSNILEVTNANKNKLVYNYDGLGNLLNVTDPAKNTVLVEMEYDDNENLITQTDGNNNTQQLAYDQQTRITGVTRADRTGKVLANTKVTYDEAVFDKFGTPFFKVTVTQKGDKQDRLANYYFDSYDRLAKLSRNNNGKEEFARYTYDYLGKTTETVDFGGQKTSAKYNALGQLVTATDAAGKSTKYSYDRLGNLIAVTDAIGKTAYFDYDRLGRKIKERAPFEAGKYAEVKYYYDNTGNLIKTVDPEGYVTKQHFNNRNMLEAVERVINSKQSNITKYEHDAIGNTTRVLKGLNSMQDKEYSAYTYKYDNLNQLIQMLDASGKPTNYEYDNNGNLTKLTDRNKVETVYTYDGLNRMTKKQNSKDGKKNAINITYDLLGQTKQMTDASGTTQFNYDTLGRLTTINYGNGIKQTYAYDRADRVANMQMLQGSSKQINLNYNYDQVGRLTAVVDNGKRFSYKYNAIGQLVEELNGVTGIKSSYQYYPSGNVKNLRHTQGKDIIASYEYKYDRRGNQTQKTEGNGTTTYYYDPLSRIKTVLTPDAGVEDYKYDDLDNIKEITRLKGGKVEETSYLYDNESRLLQQVTKKGDETKETRFTYDNVGNQLTKDEVVKRNGNLVASKESKFWYNGFNQQTRVQNPDGQFIDYTYNGNGLRTKKDFGDRAINYYYNGGNIVMETNQDNQVTAKNIRGLKLLYRESYANGITDPQYLYYLHNAHGDVTKLTNEKGQVIKDYEYDPWGNEKDNLPQAFGGNQGKELWKQEVEKIDNPFRYCGEYLDEETGNYYLRARYYDSSVQRFTQEDSYAIAFGAAWQEHAYGYAANNPIKFYDPSGHFSVSSLVSKVHSVVRAVTSSLSRSAPSGRTSSPINQQVGRSGSPDKTVTEYVFAKPRLHPEPGSPVMLRYIAERNGGTVSYSAKTQTATVKIGNTTCSYTGRIINGRMLVDSNAFANDFGISDLNKVMHKAGDKYDSASDAALAFGLTYNLTSTTRTKDYKDGREYGANIYRKENKYYFANVTPGGRTGVSMPDPDKGANRVAAVHTHAAYFADGDSTSDFFSGNMDTNNDGKLDWTGDGVFAQFNDIDLYLITPGGVLKRLNHDGQDITNTQIIFDGNPAVSIIGSGIPHQN